MTMDFQSAMETFAEAWVAANTKCTPLSEVSTQNQAMALTKGCRTPPSATTPVATGATNRDSVERATTPALPRSSASHESIVSPPAKDDFTHAKSSTGKTLPVHCIIEVITTYEDSRLLHQSPWKRRSFVDSDSYVIIPTSTPFHQVVNTVLIHLGYSHDNVLTAKGSVVIKNWKALSVDQISDDPHVTVEDILGELTTVATLRIQVSRSRSTVLMDMKEKLLCFFIKQSRGLLNSSGCPIDEHLLSQICRFGYGNEIPAAEISEDSFRKFDQWWSSQLPTLSPNNRGSLTPYGCQYPLVPLHNSKSLERTDPPHPAIQNVHNQFPTQKTRMRTSFDPELELPKLQQWFSDNQHPNRQQIQQYVKELNSLESRRGRKPLDMNNVVYWFKNARAAQKRAEVRNINPAVSSHMPINGYSDHNSSVLSMADCYLNTERSAEHAKNNSPTSYKRSYQDRRLSDDLSNDSSEEEDEIDNQSRSPTAPLSLTTSDKNDYPRSSTPSSEIQIVNPKIEPKEEPINYHSPEHNSTKINASDTEENGEMNEENKPRVRSPPTTPQSDRSVPHNYCESPDFDRHIQSRGPNDGLERLTAGFPLVPFNHSIMYMNQYIPGLPHSTGTPSLSADERRKRNRTFIDPVTEVPKLEYWFSVNTHPTHNSIVQYTDALNCMSYRQKFPRLEPKNVQFWFKNRRAKCKRLKMSMFDSQSSVHYHEDRE